MTSVDYVAVANIIGDDLLFEGKSVTAVLGGAGTYAAAGMRVWTDHVGIVSGAGEDFEPSYGGWFARNQIDQSGILIRGAHTPRSWVNYLSPDERVETPQFGAEHFRVMEPRPRDLPADYRQARGVYLFRDAETAYWNEAFELQAKHRSVLLWEAHAGIADAACWRQVADILSHIDLFSINLAEASQLCATAEPKAIVDKLRSTGVKGLALRLGSKGAIVADRQTTWEIPTYPVEVVDVTGAGNAFSGGFLVGYCEVGADIAAAGVYAAVAASFALQQFGPPNVDSHTRQDAVSRMRRIAPRQIG